LWLKIGSCCEASSIFLSSFNAFERTYCDSRNLCGFPLVDVDQQKDSKTKKNSTTVGGGQKRELPKCLQTRHFSVKIIVDDLIGGGGFQSDPKTESALEEVVDDLIGGGILQSVFKHEACL